jgi:hypothetical protein
MEKMAIRLNGGVAEFIFGASKDFVIDDIGQIGLEAGRDRKGGKIVAYLSLDFPEVYDRILQGLQEKPISGRFSVESVEDYEKTTPICDPEAKNATFAEIVQWLWKKYYAHLEEPAAAGV